MATYYDSVGLEPTYELAENIIQSIIHNLKFATDYLNEYPNPTGYTEYSLDRLGHTRITRFTINKSEIRSAAQIIINHFPDLLIKHGNTLYIKDGAKQQLNANDLIIMEYYCLLLSEYEERLAKYQRYLKEQQNIRRIKSLFVLFMPILLVICMFLVGD